MSDPSLLSRPNPLTPAQTADAQRGGIPRAFGPAISALLAVSCALLSAACGVPEPPSSTGGVDPSAGECGRGLVVVSSDYQSSNISLLDPYGDVLSSSFISSASSSVGLSAPLSGDVVPPGSVVTGDQLVLLDRYPAAVITWVDLSSARVTAQLNVGTGFNANPHDYVEAGPQLAYISRFEPNPRPGRQAFDAGNDLLLVDPTGPSIIGRVDLTPAFTDSPEAYYPRADKLKLVGDSLYVLASGYSADFQDSIESRLLRINTHSQLIEDVVLLSGLHGCGGLALAPSANQLAISCAGPFNSDLLLPYGSGIALVDITGSPKLSRVILAGEVAEDAVAYAITYASDRSLLFTTFGRFPSSGSARMDGLYQLDLTSFESQRLLSSESLPFSFGDLRCEPTCGYCFLADAARGGGVVHRFALEEPPTSSGEQPGAQRLGVVQLTLDRAIRPDTLIGLPPRYLGSY